ncbi:MAG: hypothetical protein AAFR47_09095 [Pseudomonadota bacterium]
MAQGGFRVEEVRPLSLSGSGLTRDIPIPPDRRNEDFESRYDFDTLWYDAIPDPKGVRLICPKLFNLASVLRNGLRLNGRRAGAIRLRRHKRHDEVLVTGAAAEQLELVHGNWRAEAEVSRIDTTTFAGLNASLHISRNNRLEWIADWARFHIAEHGLQAMLLMDNASDMYGPEDILEALAQTGLERAIVLKVPHPYGPPRGKTADGRRVSGNAKFLQPAMLNLARMRFLSQARAVLNADIDELIWTKGGSVFDAAVESRTGLVSIAGRWRMPSPQASAPSAHVDHTHLRPGDKPCPTKYCIAPNGPLGRFRWDVHRLETWLPLGRTPSPEFGYWHCRGITTNWKSYERLSFKSVGARDTMTAAVLDRAFSKAPARLPPAQEGETVTKP